MKTSIRRLNGVSYWIIEDPEGIYDFVNTALRREWEEDARSEGRNPKEDAWLKALPKLGSRLETTEMDRVKLDPEIMNYVDVKNGYTFQTSLVSRSQELKETIERFASVIWPLTIKKRRLCARGRLLPLHHAEGHECLKNLYICRIFTVGRVLLQ